MATMTIERRGQRVYFLGNTFAHKDAIKAMGGHWDGDARAWWVQAKKEKEAKALLAEIGAGFDLTDPVDRAVRADQLAEQGDDTQADALRAGPPAEDLDGARVYAQVEYKGRRYYVIAETKDVTRCRLTTLDGLPNGPFWVDCSACNLIRRYEGREVWNGRRNSGKTRTQYPTIGSLRRFREQQADPTTARGECTECGKYGPRGVTCSECMEGTHV